MADILGKPRLLPLLALLFGCRENELDELSSSETVAEWDSLRQLFLASMLEQEYNVELSPAQMERLTSVAGIRSVLAEHAYGADEVTSRT